MFLYRAVFIIGFVSIAFVAQVSAFILPLTRYMLDAVPEGAESPDAAAKLVPVSAADPSSSAADTGTDVPVAVENSPGDEGQEDAAEPSESIPVSGVGAAESTAASAADTSTPSAASQVRVEQSNAAGHTVVLSSTTVLVGSIVAGILFAA